MKLFVFVVFSFAMLGLGATTASARLTGGVGVGNGPGTLAGGINGCTGTSYHGCACHCAGSGGPTLANCQTGYTDDGRCQFCMGDSCAGSIGTWGPRAMFP